MIHDTTAQDALFHWKDGGQIGAMQTKSAGKGVKHCIIYPNAAADADIVADMMHALSKVSARQPYFVSIEDNAAIFVPAVENVDAVLEIMQRSGAIEGAAQEITPTVTEQQSLPDKIKKNMMNIGGAVGLLGHISLMAKGVKHQKLDVFGTGLGILNPITQAVLGTGDHERKYEHLMSKMQMHLVETGVLARPVVTIETKKGFFEGVGAFIQENPQLVGFGLGNIGSLSMMYNSFSPENTNKVADRMISGTSIVGNCAVMFMPERVFPEHHEYAKITQEPGRWLWETVQSQPLKFNGVLNASDNLCWAKKIWDDMHNPTIDTFDKWSTAITGVSFGLSTMMVSFFSTKEEPMADRVAKYDKIYDLAANLLIEIPADNREIVMQQMAGFLSAQSLVENAGMSIEEIAQGIKKHLDVMKKTSWIQIRDDVRESVEPLIVAANIKATMEEPLPNTPSNIVLEHQQQSLERMQPNEMEQRAV